MSKTIYNEEYYNGSGAKDPTAWVAINHVEKKKKPINSRSKGAEGEREFARICKNEGYDCRRGQQYSGLGGEDVVGLPGIHIEVKRVDRLNIHEAIDQSKRDAKPLGTMPIVAHRRNKTKWLVTMDIEDWFEIYREWEAGQVLNNETDS